MIDSLVSGNVSDSEGGGKTGPGRRKSASRSTGKASEAPSKSPDKEPREAAVRLSFEEAFSIAENAVDGLERGELTLEESLRTYEKGLRALGRCYEVLKHLDRKIEVLGSELGSVVEGDEGVTWKPAESTARLRDALGAVNRAEELPLPGAEEEGAEEEDAADD